MAQSPRTYRTDTRGSSDERGAALIEFALVAPVLIMIMMGIVQLGLLLHQLQGLHAAAREGARQGSFPDTTEAEIEASVASALSGISFGNTPLVTITPDNASGVPCDESVAGADEVTVSIQVNSVLDIPFLAGQTVTLNGDGTFRCEYLN